MSESQATSPAASRSGAQAPRIEDQWVDQVVPEGFDWKAVVREHPLVSIALVAAGGFALGRWQGRQIVDAASEMASARLTSSVDRMVDAARGGQG